MVRYTLIQAVKITTVRFDENLRIGVIQGEVTLNCEKMAGMMERIMIHESLDTNNINQILARNPVKQCVFVFHKTSVALLININKILQLSNSEQSTLNLKDNRPSRCSIINQP